MTDPSNERVGSSDPRASPSTIPSTPTLSENSDDDSDAVPDLLKLNETLSTHGNLSCPQRETSAV